MMLSEQQRNNCLFRDQLIVIGPQGSTTIKPPPIPI